MRQFFVFVLMAFVTAFVGISWAMRGFPVGIANDSPIGKLQPTVSATFGDETPEKYEQKKSANAIAAQKDSNPKLDQIRLDTLQAANAYALSPCDQTIKQNLIASLTAYTRAWQEKLGCARPQGTLMFCGDEKLKNASVAFSSPLDVRVKEALDKAFEQKGILKADFPQAVRFDMLQFAGPNLWAGENPVCIPLLRAANRGK